MKSIVKRYFYDLDLIKLFLQVLQVLHILQVLQVLGTISRFNLELPRLSCTLLFFDWRRT
jgi:hypothetical protein